MHTTGGRTIIYFEAILSVCLFLHTYLKVAVSIHRNYCSSWADFTGSGDILIQSDATMSKWCLFLTRVEQAWFWAETKGGNSVREKKLSTTVENKTGFVCWTYTAANIQGMGSMCFAKCLTILLDTSTAEWSSNSHSTAKTFNCNTQDWILLHSLLPGTSTHRGRGRVQNNFNVHHEMGKEVIPK